MYKKYKLGNGLEIVMEKIDYVHSVSVGVFVANGSRHESRSLSGISHFIEHMLFKGTKSRSAFDIAEAIDSVGGQINAYTTKEYTCFYAKMLDENVDIALDMLSDMLINPLLSDKDIELEKNVVYEEIAMYEDSPEDLIHETILETAWGEESGLGAPTFGTKKTLETFNSQIIKEYMNKMYVPQNCVISVAGNFGDDLIELIEKYFGAWKGKKSENIVFDEKYQSRVIVRKKEIEQVHFCMGFSAYEIDNEKNYPLLAFNNAFGANMSSTLFQKVREKYGLVYSIFSYISNFEDAGIFVISASMKKENLGEVLKIVAEEAKKAKESRFDEKKMYSMKQQLKGSYILGLENTSARMQSIGRSQLLLGKIRTAEEVIEKIDAITPQNTHESAREVLDFESMTACIMGDTSEKDKDYFENLF